MNKKNSLFIHSLVLISLALGSASVEAKRFGEGTSFGSKTAYSAPVKSTALPPSNRMATPPPVANHTGATPLPPSTPIPSARPQATNSNQAWKDRAMGAAAGLAVGGLVGSMMGNSEHPVPQSNQGYAQPNQGYAQPAQPSYTQPMPMQQQGGGYAPIAPMPQNQGYMPDYTGTTRSNGIGFLGYLLIAGLGYLAYRFFFAKKKPSLPLSQPDYQRTSNEPAYSAPMGTTGSSADFNTDVMFKKGDSTVSLSRVNLAKSRDTATPMGFNSVLFLDDVKHRYMNLQTAWDARDFAEIRGLTTDKVFAEIQEQLKSSNEINHTDILTLDADLLEIRELSSEFEAAVLFESMIRENASAPAEQVREVWHFIKLKSGINSNWMLDGIQQVED